jgi:type I restriction enzyme S subunit
MGGEWPTVRLGDYVDSCLGKMLDKEKNRGEFFPYLGNKNVRWGSFDTDDLAQMRFEEHEYERYGLHEGDLVVCEGGEPGRCAIWEDQIPGMKIQKALHRIRAKENLDNRFLHYWFLLSGKTGALEPYFTGTTIKHLTGKAIAELPIPLPPLEEQKSIAHILGTLDDKIELNRQMNATLEAMAQALFKSWFVDFDPVIDNALAAGNPIPEPLQTRAQKRQALGDKRKPLPQEIQKQFPDRFVFSEEMGWIPEGWEILTVGDVFDVTMGQSPPGNTYNEIENGIPFFQGRADFGFRYPSNRVYCTEPRRLAKKGDTLVSVRAPVGDVNMAADNCCIGRGVSASRHKSGSRSFTYYAMLQLREHFKVYEAEGTVFGSINQKDFKALSQLDIPNSLVAVFESYASHFDQKIEFNSINLVDLTKLRDTLLPKLLSGELRIPDAEKILEQAL